MNTDLRIIKTKESIKKVIKEMIEQYDYNKITVKELTQRAHIHRKTFYLHYGCIEDLFEELIEEIAQNYIEVINTMDKQFDMVKINEQFFSFYTSQEPYVERLLCNPSYSHWCQLLFHKTLSYNLNHFKPYIQMKEEKIELINVFLSSSSIEIYRWWVLNEKRMPLDDVIDLSSRLLNNGVEKYIKQIES